MIIILQQTPFLRTPLAGAFVPTWQSQMWPETSEGHGCAEACHSLPRRMGERAAAVLGDPSGSQPAAPLLTGLELFTPAGKGKKKGFRAVMFFLWLLLVFSFSHICHPQTFIYE